MAITPNRYRLHIDWTKCDGRGLCTELLPDLLGRDGCGQPVSANCVGTHRSDYQRPRCSGTRRMSGSTHTRMAAKTMNDTASVSL
jgi:hypothetical protein